MAGLAHAGIGLAAKRFAPTIPVTILIVAAYIIDIVWGVLYVTGIERYPTEAITTANPWSHGLLLSVIWSLLSGIIAYRVTYDRNNAIIIGVIVFSHWIIDFISHPMLATFPLDTGLPLLFDGSPLVGLGLWRYETAMNLGEYGAFSIGCIMYVLYLRRDRLTKESIPQIESNK